VRYTREEVREALSAVDIPRYFTGFTLEELTEGNHRLSNLHIALHSIYSTFVSGIIVCFQDEVLIIRSHLK